MFLCVLFTYSSFLDSFSFLAFFLYLYLFSMILIFFHSLFYVVPLPCSNCVRFSYVLLVLSCSFLLWRRMLNFWEKMFELRWCWSMIIHKLRLLNFHALTFMFQNVSSSSSSYDWLSLICLAISWNSFSSYNLFAFLMSSAFGFDG